MSKFKKVKAIASSFVAPLPKDESWYQERLKSCDTCEKNSDNVPKEHLSVMEEIKINFTPCPEKRVCTACGCCIDRKAAVKTEVCGLKELGLEPKWHALSVESPTNSGISLESLTPNVGSLFMEGFTFIVDVPPTSEELVVYEFIMRRKGGLKFKDFQAPCSCTVPSVKVIDKESVKMEAKISTKSFKKGLNERSLVLYYYQGGNSGVGSVSVKFKIKKI